MKSRYWPVVPWSRAGTKSPTCRRPGRGTGPRNSHFSAGLIHDRGADPRIGELLAGGRRHPISLPTRSRYRPPTFVSCAVPTIGTRACRGAWSRKPPTSRPLLNRPGPTPGAAADFTRFRPWLERVVRLCRESAAAVDSAADPYDVLLSYYDPALTTSPADRSVRRPPPGVGSDRTALCRVGSPTGPGNSGRAVSGGPAATAGRAGRRGHRV